MVASVACEVAILRVDHGQADAHVAREVEGGYAGTGVRRWPSARQARSDFGRVRRRRDAALVGDGGRGKLVERPDAFSNRARLTVHRDEYRLRSGRLPYPFEG